MKDILFTVYELQKKNFLSLSHTPHTTQKRCMENTKTLELFQHHKDQSKVYNQEEQIFHSNFKIVKTVMHLF